MFIGVLISFLSGCLGWILFIIVINKLDIGMECGPISIQHAISHAFNYNKEMTACGLIAICIWIMFFKRGK
jgi:hypothetical protein